MNARQGRNFQQARHFHLSRFSKCRARNPFIYAACDGATDATVKST